MRALLIPLMLLGLAPSAHAQQYRLDEAHSHVSAKVSFFGLSSKAAQFPRATGAINLDPAHPDAVSLDIRLDARALTADDTLTQGRLKGPAFFDVDHYPEVRFSGQHMTMQGPRAARIEGTMTARGISRPASLDVTFAEDPALLSSNHAIQLRAVTTIDRTDFGMTAYRFVVGRTVTVAIDATMTPALATAVNMRTDARPGA